MDVVPYRLGCAVKLLGEGGLRTHDARRWQNGPHLRRSLELLDAAFAYLDRHDIRVFRLSSSTVPYGTHPDLPGFDYRHQIEECREELGSLGAKARAYGLRLSTHPGQYTVLSSPDPVLRAKSLLDLEQDALLLEALGQGPEAAVVVHVGGRYESRTAALDRWSRAYETLSERARRRVAVEHDELLFDLGDALELHRRTGVRVVFDLLHHRCKPARGLEYVQAALVAAYETWGDVRPKAHLSSPRTELRRSERRRSGSRRKDVRLLPPALAQHADFATPWDLLELLAAAPGPIDVMVEAKAKDLAVLWLREQLERLGRSGEPAEEEAKQRVPHGRLPERARVPEERRDAGLSPGGVVAVDEVRERIERDVLGQSGGEGEAARRHRDPRAKLVERDPEHGSVQRVQREPGDGPRAPARHRLPEERDVGVVAAEEAPIERLREAPGSRGGGSGGGRSRASAHARVRSAVTACVRLDPT